MSIESAARPRLPHVPRVDPQTPKGSLALLVQIFQRAVDLSDWRPQPLEQAKPRVGQHPLRVVRFNKRTPRRISNCRIEWLRAEGVTPSPNAATRKLSSSATATNAVRLAGSPR